MMMKKMKYWSLATAVRNPERIRSFLQILKLLEGEIWHFDTQIKYQTLLIQHKLYGFGEAQFHKTLTTEQNSWFDNNLTYDQALNILQSKNYTGGSDMRGRQSFNPLHKMGLAFINDKKQIQISALGNYFLQDNYDLGEVFFKSLIKWQYLDNVFNIKPFIATLHLINKVNTLCNKYNLKVKGISKLEFSLFVITLNNYLNINNVANKIIEHRINNNNNNNNNNLKNDLNNNLDDAEFKTAQDYSDNLIRYFRLTKYIYIRGNGYYIDLEPRRLIEINSLLQFDNASALIFNNKKEYIKYLGDLNTPVLPWQQTNTLNKIITNLLNEVNNKQQTLININISFNALNKIEFNNINNIQTLQNYINDIRLYIKYLDNLIIHNKAQSITNINNYINNLTNIFKEQYKRPVLLEQNIASGLHALNDAIAITPNYPVGDDNEPTFTAPANKADIECFYASFNAICEVTLLTNRTQWYNEGQPVMRHLRDFEQKNPSLKTYCLFIAPKLHRDTINTFWMAVKYEYEGKSQKIIPLTIAQFISLLTCLKQCKNNGYNFKHQSLKQLYDDILKLTNITNNSESWLKEIPSTIANWQQKLIK